MSDEMIKRFVAGLNNPETAELLHKLGAKLLEGKPLSLGSVATGIADDRVLGKLKRCRDERA